MLARPILSPVARKFVTEFLHMFCHKFFFVLFIVVTSKHATKVLQTANKWDTNLLHRIC